MKLDDAALDQIFRKARTHNAWQPRPIGDDTLRELHGLLRWGPTSANCQPARFVFVRTSAGKERLRPFLDPGNVKKTMAAPVTAIVAYDLRFYEYLPAQFYDTGARSWFEGKPKKIEVTALRNGSLQGAYMILAARALGLDCGPMSGFDNDKLDAEFFPDGRFKSNFLCNLAYGDPKGLHPRGPRLEFDVACRLE